MAEMYSDIPELSAEQANILRRKKIAEMIQAKSMEGIPSQPQMGRYAVPTNPLLALGKIGEAYFAKQAMDNAGQDQTDLASKHKLLEDAAINKFNTSYNDQPFKPNIYADKAARPDTFDSSDTAALGMEAQKRSQDEKRQAVIDAMTSPFTKLNKTAQARGLFDQQDQAREDAQAAKLEEQKNAAELAMSPEAKLMRERDKFPEGSQQRQEISNILKVKGTLPQNIIVGAEGTYALDRGSKKPVDLNINPKESGKGLTLDGDKPMPPNALKLQQDNLNELGIASGIQANMMKHVTAIEDSKLDLGLATNIGSRISNLTGKSSENSKAFATFKADMEQMRNDSLRLNKGTQTEGDATRAWNELFENMSDKDVVLSRIKYINEKNAQAAEEKKNNVNLIRSNFGNGPMDFSIYEKRATDAKNRRATDKAISVNEAQHGETRTLPNGQVMIKTPAGWIPK